MNETDVQLLRRYALNGAEDAFSQLVQRHLALVYSAALRQVRSPELAEEVSQAVFLDLARHAHKLPPNTILTAWLYQVARRSAIDVVRRERRRQAREQIAHELSGINMRSSDWSEIEPLLDEAMETLDEKDRTAVLLRYFENKSLREVGETLGTSENAAQKRLTRAVDRLSQFFNKRGVRIGAAGITIAISNHATLAVPAGLGAAISALAAQAGTASTITATAVTSMTMLKKTVIAASLVAAIGTGVYQNRKADALQKQVLELTAGVSQAARLKDSGNALEDALRQVALLREENEALKRNLPELLRLRDEVTRLRRDAKVSTPSGGADSSAELAAKNWMNRLEQLKQRLEQMPEYKTPEMQLLAEEDWLAAVKQPNLETEEDYRKAFAHLRNTAQSKMAAIVQPALTDYLRSNNFVFPSDLSELLPYLGSKGIEPAMLERYAILPASTVPNVKMGGDWAITQKSPIDAELDQRIVIGPNGYGSASYPREQSFTEQDFDTLKPVFKAFSAANNGKEATDPLQIEPYISTTEQKAALEKFLKSRDQKNTTKQSAGSKAIRP